MALTATNSNLAASFNSTRYDVAAPNAPRKKPKSTTNTTIDLRQDDVALVNNLKDLFNTARAHRKPMVQRWNKCYKMLRGNVSLADGRPANKLNINEIFPICRSWVGWMTDRRFHHTVAVSAAPFTAFYEFYSNLAKDLETVLDSTFFVNCEEAEITLGLWDTAQYGTAIFKTCWDNTLAGGMGDAKMSRVDPYGFYPDPAGKDLASCNYIIEARNMSLQELDRRFPGSAPKFRAGGNIDPVDEAPDQLSTSSSRFPRANPAAISPSTDNRYGPPGASKRLSTSSALLDDEGITVLECWIREHDTYDATVDDPETGESTEQHVFDGWRVIVVAGNQILLNESAKDIWQHGQHPYSRYVAYDLGEFWGLSLVELLISGQETINRLLNAAVLNIDLTGNPIMLEDTQASTQRQSLSNTPGRRVTKNASGEVKWLDPPRIQSDIPQFLSYFLQRMQNISGMSDINRGQNPGGRNAADVHDAVQESAFVGIRMALRSLEYTLRDTGHKKASLIVENYTVPRMTAILGPEGERSTLALRSRHFMVPTENGAIPMDFTLMVDAGSSSDTSRKVREDKMMTLFTLGAIDAYTLLEALNIPNRTQVIQRVQQMQQAGLQNPPGKRERARA